MLEHIERPSSGLAVTSTEIISNNSLYFLLKDNKAEICFIALTFVMFKMCHLIHSIHICHVQGVFIIIQQLYKVIFDFKISICQPNYVFLLLNQRFEGF